MGSRGNIFMVQHPSNGVASGVGIFMYSHYSGHALPEILQTVLKRNVRWNDEPYLARMIFSAMIKDDVSGELGAGLSTYLCDYNYPILVVNSEEQTVSVADAVDGNNNPLSAIFKTYSFNKFCELSPETINEKVYKKP
jgi:hypothetical protein